MITISQTENSLYFKTDANNPTPSIYRKQGNISLMIGITDMIQKQEF